MTTEVATMESEVEIPIQQTLRLSEVEDLIEEKIKSLVMDQQMVQFARRYALSKIYEVNGGLELGELMKQTDMFGRPLGINPEVLIFDPLTVKRTLIELVVEYHNLLKKLEGQ